MSLASLSSQEVPCSLYKFEDVLNRNYKKLFEDNRVNFLYQKHETSIMFHKLQLKAQTKAKQNKKTPKKQKQNKTQQNKQI